MEFSFNEGVNLFEIFGNFSEASLFRLVYPPVKSVNICLAGTNLWMQGFPQIRW